MSTKFSGAVEGSVGSVQFQIVPCSTLHFFSKSIHPFQCLVSANYRALICCTCDFQRGSLFFVYFGFLCWKVYSVSNFRPDTRGRRQSLFRLTCSVVLWGGKDTADKHRWCVWGVLSVWATLGLPQLRAHVLSRSTLLRLQVVLPGNCPKHILGFVHFPGLSCSGSGSWVLHKGTDSVGLCILCPSQA